MKFRFEDDTFAFETLRTTGFANYFGADLGEVLTTAARITDGDQGSRHREWKATAGRVAELRDWSVTAGHRVAAHFEYQKAAPEITGKVERIKVIAERHGVPIKAAALHFVLAHPAVVAVIPGASRRNQHLVSPDAAPPIDQ